MPSNNNVCRFCLRLVHEENVELINEVTQKILGVLLIKLDLDVSENPMKCKTCSSILDAVYMFKSKCLYSEDVISAHLESNLKVNLIDVLIKLKDKPDINVAGDGVVCRLCIKIPPGGGYIALAKTSEEVSHCRDVIQMQLPEVNLNITEDPIICEACHVLLKNYLCFVTNCMNVEKNIKMYREHQGSDLKEQVDLLCVLQFTENKAEDSFNGDLVIKHEDSSVHVKVEKIEQVENDNLLKEHFTDGSTTEFYIKEEEIEIKSEGDQISSEQCTCSANSKKFEVSHKHKPCISRPKIILQCDFHTKCRSSSSMRKETHDPIKKKFKCERCDYSACSRRRMSEHLGTHMELGEAVLYYCATCDFKSKYKRNLKAHLRSCPNKKDGTDSVVMLECNQCDFRTNIRKYLTSHKKIHDPTKYVFKCEQCKYCTYLRTNLKRHLLSHMELGGTVMYDCATCDFKSKYGSSLGDHIKRCLKKKAKDDMDSRVMLQCNQCSFRTRSKNTLYMHKKTHDPAKRKFKCQQCDYWSFYTSQLKEHQVTHMELGKTVVYYCATCDFQSKYKRNLKSHLTRCPKKKDGTDQD